MFHARVLKADVEPLLTQALAGFPDALRGAPWLFLSQTDPQVFPHLLRGDDGRSGGDQPRDEFVGAVVSGRRLSCTPGPSVVRRGAEMFGILVFVGDTAHLLLTKRGRIRR